MLLNDFYSIHDTTNNNDEVTEIELSLNAEHPIFDGHFPEQPVVPGVCMIQMVTEMAGHLLNRKLQLVESSNVKFLKVIDPRVNPFLKLTITWNEVSGHSVSLDAILHCNDTASFKFKGVFQ